MRVLACLSILAATLVAAPRTQDLWENSFGVVPLHSTRADVERLYGTSSDSCRCIFRTSNETIHVKFATAPCGLPVFGWNVPRDTVLSFTVTPNVPLRFSEIASNLNGFIERNDPHEPRTTYYSNVDKGIGFSVQDGYSSYVTYFPPKSENVRRCQGFPPYDGLPPPRPFDTIFNRNKSEINSRLDNLAIELSRDADIRGYIVTYAGKISQRGEAKQMAEDARRHLLEKRMISPDRIVAIDGGYRETAQYDLFMLSLDMPPPTPTPTVPSNKVQIVGTTRHNKRPFRRVNKKPTYANNWRSGSAPMSLLLT